MAKSKSSLAALPDIPWQERPAGCTDVVWRYDRNPVIARDAIPCSNSIFNSAVVPFRDGFAGVFRVDDKRRASRLHTGFSADGLNWEISNDPIEFPSIDPKTKGMRVAGGYDPRVVWIEDRFWITWCTHNMGATIGVAYTKDFKKYTQVENAFVPFNRNGVLFPRKINGEYVMLNRPSDNGHTPFGDIFLSHSKDMVYWGKHRHVMARGLGWGWTKIGAGPIPIETPDGWLLIYHGVATSCSGMTYSFSAALLDLDEPWKVLHRPAAYMLAPQKLYECVGDVPNVAFPCATLLDPPTGRLAIYYGGADTVVCLAFGYLQEIIDFCKKG